MECAEVYAEADRERKMSTLYHELNCLDFLLFVPSLAGSRLCGLVSGRIRSRSKEWSATVVARRFEWPRPATSERGA